MNLSNIDFVIKCCKPRKSKGKNSVNGKKAIISDPTINISLYKFSYRGVYQKWNLHNQIESVSFTMKYIYFAGFSPDLCKDTYRQRTVALLQKFIFFKLDLDRFYFNFLSLLLDFN